MSQTSGQLRPTDIEPLPKRALCIYEDRHSDIVGVKLLLLSIRRHAPSEHTLLFFPDAPQEVREFVEGLGSAVELREPPKERLAGWNIKPGLMRHLLDEGWNEIVFIDSDIVLTGSLFRVMPPLPPETLGVTQEYRYALHNGGFFRVDAWGMERGNSHPTTLNTCVLRITEKHRELLERWEELSGSSTFQQAQAKPWNQRPLHMVGGQDVLTAMLGSAEWKHVPVHFGKRGSAIAQCFMEDGYTTFERLAGLFQAKPAMVHAQGGKPWRPSETDRLYVQLSPYAAAADAYADELPEVRAWSRPRSKSARLCHAVALGHPAVRGVPLSLTRELRRLVGFVLRTLKLKAPPPTVLAATRPA
ncbi:MAG: hypothetical protein AAGH92_01420 [Planctomycetota bacterium]